MRKLTPTLAVNLLGLPDVQSVMHWLDRIGGMVRRVDELTHMDSEPSLGSVMDYPLVYEDEFGTVETTCRSDGHGFVFRLRGRTFRGRSFDCLWVDGSEMTDLPRDLFPVKSYGPENEFGDLIAKFTIKLPLDVLGAAEPAGQLVLSFDCRDGDMVEGILTVDGAVYTQTSCGWVEGNLIGLQRQLPAGVFLACCLSCRCSQFNPAGAQDIGSLGCFVDWPDMAAVSNKAEASKGDVFRAWHEAQDQGKLQLVQETWLCPRFRLIQPGEPAYKDWDFFVYGKDGRVPPAREPGQ